MSAQKDAYPWDVGMEVAVQSDGRLVSSTRVHRLTTTYVVTQDGRHWRRHDGRLAMDMVAWAETTSIRSVTDEDRAVLERTRKAVLLLHFVASVVTQGAPCPDMGTGRDRLLNALIATMDEFERREGA